MKLLHVIYIIIFCSAVFSNDAEGSKSTIDFDEIEASIEQLFQEALVKEERLVGGAITLVTSNKVLMNKGYGWSDLALKNEFHPKETIAMTASVSKVVTLTAFLQLLEKKEVSLETRVKDLVPNINIDNPYEQPVLVKHLLTHTAGFDDSSMALEAKDRSSLLSIEQQLRKTLPPIVWPPGQFYNYSNHGIVLLAHIIEELSGQPFNQYMEENLLNKLEMNQSGFDYNNRSSNKVMKRYKWKTDNDGKLFVDDSYGFKYTNQIGAAGFHTTAFDMSRFLQMYLKKGLYEGARVLPPESINYAMSPHFFYHPELERKQGLIWRIRETEKLTYYYHSGDDTGIESMVLLIPEYDIGVFVVANSDEGNSLKYQIRDSILTHLSKNLSVKELPSRQPSKDISQDFKKYHGIYQYMNDGQSSIDRLTYLFGDVLEVSSSDGVIKINANQYVPMAEGLFARKESNRKVNFFRLGDRYYLSQGYATYRQLKWYEVPIVHKILLISSFMSMLIVGLIWTVQAFRKKKVLTDNNGYLKLFFAVTSICFIVFLVILAISSQGITMKFGAPSEFGYLFSLPLIGLAVFLVGILGVPKFMLNGNVSVAQKVLMALIILANICSILIYHYYNLIGFNYI